MSTDPNGHVGPAFNLVANSSTLREATPVATPEIASPPGPPELVLPPSNAPETISVDDIRRRGMGIYEAGWGSTLPHGGHTV